MSSKLQLIKRDSNSKTEKRTVCFRLPVGKYRQLNELARDLNTTVSDVIQQLIDNVLINKGESNE